MTLKDKFHEVYDDSPLSSYALSPASMSWEWYLKEVRQLIADLVKAEREVRWGYFNQIKKEEEDG